jgi:hypothetical protein
MSAHVVMLAAALNGLLAGASLDQSIKQLPSRHRTGLTIYASYVRGADLASGVPWYAILANGAVLATLAAAVLAWRAQSPAELRVPLELAALLSLAHSAATLMAAPTLFRTRKVPLDDAAALKALFDKFARWQAIRATLQVLTFALCLWSLMPA